MDINFSKHQEIVKDRGAWSDTVHGVAKSWIGPRDWTTRVVSKESACQCRRHRRCGFDPWARKQEMATGVGNGNMIQYSCLRKSMVRGAWWATVHGIAKSRTWLSDWEHTHAQRWLRMRREGKIEKEISICIQIHTWRGKLTCWFSMVGIKWSCLYITCNDFMPFWNHFLKAPMWQLMYLHWRDAGHRQMFIKRFVYSCTMYPYESALDLSVHFPYPGMFPTLKKYMFFL